MQIDLQTINIKPLRQNFDHLTARFGDKPASRYQEATYDIQQTYLYHYKPTWEPELEIFDERRTAIRMKDWYDFKDPRQFYYGTYTLARSRMQDAADAAFEFALDSGMPEALPDAARRLIVEVAVPMRHYEWGANMNNTFISAYGYGTAIEAACMFAAMDRLGIAQQLSRVGLALDGEAALDDAKTRWMDAAEFQPLRRLVEDTFVVKDWFELFIAQNLVMDGWLHPFLYTHVEQLSLKESGAFFGLTSKFQKDWSAETVRWVDAMVKAAIGDSDANRNLVAGWVVHYTARTREAVEALAAAVFGDEAASVVSVIDEAFAARLTKIGL
ncbi:MAG TPA: phenol hydroxylase [Rhodocyclaceae bacterium]|nr:phenol hydroxylase [Rhodocyclaceae bacterium]HNB80364.1 phenol hydroxylase [Rhodocyclaceae bacterium]HNH99709.1 phenol hydroxylase [Rhodocyclaceae bacterium]